MEDLFRARKGIRWRDLAGADRVLMTYHARGAIYQYLVRLCSMGGDPRRTVLIPAFHCPTVVDPVLNAGFETRYYRVDAGLNIVTDDLLHKLDHTVAAVVFIRYFGIVEADASLIAACQATGARVIDDCSHAFLAATPPRLYDRGADATIYSFWKLVPSIVGGGVLLAGESQAGWPRSTRVAARDSLARIRRHADQISRPTREMLRRRLGRTRPLSSEQPQRVIQRPAAEAYPWDSSRSMWRMPASSRSIVERVNLAEVASARRRNYEALAAGIGAGSELTPIRRALQPDDCPWGFPFILPRRAERDYRIRARGVPIFSFGEVLHPDLAARHPGEREMLDEAEYLSRSLCAVAIHQGIERWQVEQFAVILGDLGS